MTLSPLAVWTVRSYRLVSWLTQTADVVLSLVLPVSVSADLVESVDLTSSPGSSSLMFLVLPSAICTLVSALKLQPPRRRPPLMAPKATPWIPPVMVAAARPFREQLPASTQSHP